MIKWNNNANNSKNTDQDIFLMILMKILTMVDFQIKMIRVQ